LKTNEPPPGLPRANHGNNLVRKGCALVVVTNFSSKKLIVPKATVLGVAEEMTAEIERKAYSRDSHSNALSLDAQVATVEGRYGDRRARLRKRRSRKRQSRSFNVGDIVYLYNPARKPGKCFKFHKFWTGPFQVTAKLSELNYEIVSMSHKKQVVHISRLKLVYDTEIWKTKPGPEVNSKAATQPNK